ncbi:MAG: sigma-54 dependent transcriptional regulator [Planctomycetota bacterium]
MSQKRSTVLVVDDKELMRDSVASTLVRAGLRVVTASGADAAYERVAGERPDAVLTDLKMPGGTGIDLLGRIREIDTDLPVVLMTAFGTIDTAVEAMKLGAFDYVGKPFEGDEVVVTIKRAIEHGRLIRENRVLRAAAEEPRDPAAGSDRGAGLDRLIGSSPAIRRVKEQVLAVAESQGTVLVVGESGAGKEVVARAVHELSDRSPEPYLAVNCAALSESLLESELFGHEKGAFTGADQARKGRFELAHRGTLLLDEISEIGTGLQAKLLRVLQERAFERVGSSTTIGVDVRVVATSNRDLPREVRGGKFRQDLFFRLNVLPVHLPPLRDRLEDVPELAEHFVRVIADREGRAVPEIDRGAILAMREYGWPGNVRELQNICERAVVLARLGGDESVIGEELIRPWLGVGGTGAMETRAMQTGAMGVGETGEPAWDGAPVVEVPERALPLSNGAARNGYAPNRVAELMAQAVEADGKTLAEIEREVIVQTLGKFGGHRQKTARELGIGVRTLGLKLKKWKEENLVEATL